MAKRTKKTKKDEKTVMPSMYADTFDCTCSLDGIVTMWWGREGSWHASQAVISEVAEDAARKIMAAVEQAKEAVRAQQSTPLLPAPDK